MSKKLIIKKTKSTTHEMAVKKITPKLKPVKPVVIKKPTVGFKTFPVVSVEMTYYSIFNSPSIKYIWSKENGFICEVKVEDLNKVLVQPLFMLKGDYRSIDLLAKKLTRF